jgi:hypothetical protein
MYAFLEQQAKSAGHVLLNLPILRDDFQHVGGFGFGVGSLLMPVKLDTASRLPSVSRIISERLKEMTDQGWDENFERLLGKNPRRHARFAALRARGLSAPILSVSWKGAQWQLGGDDRIRDVACFGASPVVHISGHIDRNGLSLSVTSSQSAATRERLLRGIVARLNGGPVTRVLTFDDDAFGRVRIAGV